MTQEITKTESQRNYQLDFLKLIFTFLVVLSHTGVFVKENTSIPFIKINAQLGRVSVHFFFVVSGMMMANSIMKQERNEASGKSAMSFVLRKFKNISWQYWTAMFIYIAIYIYIYISACH